MEAIVRLAERHRKASPTYFRAAMSPRTAGGSAAAKSKVLFAGDFLSEVLGRSISVKVLASGRAPWHVRRMVKRIGTWAFYAISTLAILYLALYAYAAYRSRDFTPGSPIHIFRNPEAPSYS